MREVTGFSGFPYYLFIYLGFQIKSISFNNYQIGSKRYIPRIGCVPQHLPLLIEPVVALGWDCNCTYKHQNLYIIQTLFILKRIEKLLKFYSNSQRNSKSKYFKKINQLSHVLSVAPITSLLKE